MNGGGDIMHEIRNLAVPFTLLLAKNGIEQLKKNKRRAESKAKSKSKSKKTKGGDCGCTKEKVGGSVSAAYNQIDNMANKLHNVMKNYL